MPAAICWNKIYVLDTAGSATQDVDLKAIHPDATLNSYTFHVEALFLNHDGGSYNNAVKSEYIVLVTSGGTMSIVGFSAASPERYGLSSSAINMTESVVSNQLRITIDVATSGPTKGRLFISVKATGDPSP